MSDDQETFQQQPLPWRRARSSGSLLALAIGWSLDEPQRIGEVALLPKGAQKWILGRGDKGEQPRLQFVRQQPGGAEPAGPLAGRSISRDQLSIQVGDGKLRVQRIGQCSMHINGVERDAAEVRPGDTLLLTNQLLLYCTLCPEEIPAPRGWPANHTFGKPDELEIVGESATCWQLRSDIAFAASSDAHVLIVGESGTGKELAARAIHRLSRRADRPFLARNAATFPAGLVDAELFGHVRDFPNAGMPERPGLIAEADGSSLFLDEIGEMPQELQSHLLRVLDAGEYQRLGESRSRRSDFRLVAATNRDPDQLKHDLAARLRLRVAVPTLGARRQDIPLLVSHLLRLNAHKSPSIVERFFDGGSASNPRIDPWLMELLLRRPYPLNIRDLDRLLWAAIADSQGDFIELTASQKDGHDASGEGEMVSDAQEPSAEQIEAALCEHDGNITTASKALGLKNRYALYRLIKSHGLEAAARDAGSEPTATQIRDALDEHDGSVSRAAKLLGLKNRFALYRLMKKHEIGTD